MKISTVLFFLNRPSQSHHLAYSSVPVRQTPFSGISLCGCYTSASISEDVKMMGRLSHCLDICAFICLRVRSELQKNAPPRCRTHSHDLGSSLLWSLKDQRLRRAAWRDTEWQRGTRVPRWLQENMKALVWDLKWKASSTETCDWIFADPVSFIFKC